MGFSILFKCRNLIAIRSCRTLTPPSGHDLNSRAFRYLMLRSLPSTCDNCLARFLLQPCIAKTRMSSYGFPMVLLCSSYGFPMVFLWFSYAFPDAFPMVFLWFSDGFPMVFLCFSCGFPIVFLWFSYALPMLLLIRSLFFWFCVDSVLLLADAQDLG